jgi:hypothetical protein
MQAPLPKQSSELRWRLHRALGDAVAADTAASASAALLLLSLLLVLLEHPCTENSSYI